MRRFLDVLFQHLRWLAVWLFAVPLIFGTAGYALDDSRVVTARIHFDPAGYVGDALSDILTFWNTPAQSAAALITQLSQTDWLSTRLQASSTWRESAPRSPEERLAELSDLRTHLRVTAEGTSLVSLAYATARPDRGVTLMAALLREVGDAFEAIESQRAAAALRVASRELERAQQDKQRAIDEVNRYAYTADQDGEALQEDSTYRRLIDAARSASDHYEELGDLAHRAQVVSGEVPGVHGQLAVVVDPPRAAPGQRMATATRYGLLGVAGALPIGVLVVYLIALHDPRLRALDDLRERVPTACLFSVPTADDPLPPA